MDLEKIDFPICKHKLKMVNEFHSHLIVLLLNWVAFIFCPLFVTYISNAQKREDVYGLICNCLV